MKKRKELNIQIGERVKISREAAGLTQEKLSEYIGVSTQYISDLERGVVGASIKTIINICTVLKVSSDFILMGRQTVESPANDLASRMECLDSAQQEVLNDIINLTIRAFST